MGCKGPSVFRQNWFLGLPISVRVVHGTALGAPGTPGVSAGTAMKGCLGQQSLELLGVEQELNLSKPHSPHL